MQAQKLVEKEVEKTPCIHHWILTTDEGVTKGLCQICGAFRIFLEPFTLTSKEQQTMAKKARLEVREVVERRLKER